MPSSSTSPTLLLFVLLAGIASLAAANTEIRNFQVGLDASTSSSKGTLSSTVRQWLGSQSYTLNATHNERSFRLLPAPLGTPLQAVCEPADNDIDSDVENTTTPGCANELWLVLDLGGAPWTRFTKFTIRLSWPAFYPTDFDIALYTPEELDVYLQTRIQVQERAKDAPLEPPDEEPSPKASSRVKHARIRLVDTGVRPPSSTLLSPNQTAEAVPFAIIVEPLLFGVLPATVLPTILFLLPVLAGVIFLFPYVMQYLEGVAAEARKELYGSEKPKLQ